MDDWTHADSASELHRGVSTATPGVDAAETWPVSQACSGLRHDIRNQFVLDVRHA